MKLVLVVAPVASAPADVPAAGAEVVGMEALELHSSTSMRSVCRKNA